MQESTKGGKPLTVQQNLKAAQQRGKLDQDYDARVYYGDLLWTRVRTRADLDDKDIATYNFGEDLEEDRQEVRHAVTDKALWGKELFCPNTFGEA